MIANKVCCISVSLAARIVGAYTMSISILMINVLVSNFFSRIDDEEFFETAKTWAILGLNWMQAFRYSELINRVQTAMVFFLIYSVLYLFASAYLALGSISRRHKCAVPWMYLQMINIIDQTIALIGYLIRDREDTALVKSMTCSIYLIWNVYLWTIVQVARKQWYEEQQNHVECELRESDPDPPSSSTNGSNLKSPSFLSQNFFILEPSTILPKEESYC
ncbi:uncharacterized protein LOC114937098 [Nylanderia fulva]|uniref:uncharacterized protein LOC114937098 n=1 Tax=Nylanderia fulva TaxID=613905 RepID=UPI0010FB593D|nr:uncharacterized protein LOC114937098 [Nylanderia fulva]